MKMEILSISWSGFLTCRFSTTAASNVTRLAFAFRGFCKYVFGSCKKREREREEEKEKERKIRRIKNIDVFDVRSSFLLYDARLIYRQNPPLLPVFFRRRQGRLTLINLQLSRNIPRPSYLGFGVE